MIDWTPLGEIVDRHRRFVLTSHARPDADALGSELALTTLLEGLGKEVRIVNPSAAPASLEFLDDQRRIRVIGRGIDATQVEDADVHLVIDTSSFAQLGDVGPVFRRTPAARVVIDHHESSDPLEATVFRDTTAAAAGVLVVEAADALGWELPPAVAAPLFAAIATDTGWYRHGSTTPHTYRLAARLMELGADPTDLYRRLYEERTPAAVRVSGAALKAVRVECGGKLAWVSVTAADLAAADARPADTEGLVNRCLAIAGTEAAFAAIEQPNGQVKFSFRSRGRCDVAALAARFGGGGHKQASGTMLPGPPEDAVKKVREAFAEVL